MLNPARRSTGNRQIDWITMPSVVPMASSDDDHDVVDDRRPHVGAEPTPGVQDRAEQRVHPVEEDLRDEEVGEDHHEVVLGGARRPRNAVDVPRVQVDQGSGKQRAKHGHHEQRDHPDGEDSLRVPLAPVRVFLGRPDEQRDHDRREDAAEHEVVHGVRQRVGVVVGVGEGVTAQGDDQHQRAQEPGSPGGDRAERHHPARPGQVRRRVVGPLRAG
jgi:hypothetical protein